MIDKAKNNKLLLLIIAILVIANIGILAFFLSGKDAGRQGNRSDRKVFISNFLQKEIGFDQQQLQTYDTLSTHHRERVGSMFEKMRMRKGQQFKELIKGDFTDSTVSAVADQSADAQKAIEVVMLNHLKNIRMLCKPEQLPKFDTLFVKVLNRRWQKKGGHK